MPSQVATTAHLRVTVDDSSPSVVQDDTDSLRITLRCLEALRSVANASSSAEQAEEASAERAGENGDESGRLMQAVRPAVDVLLSDARRAALVAPDLVQGLGVALLQACRGRLEAYLVRSFDRDAGLEGVLEAIDEAFSAVEFPDAITALSLALKLGSSLDKAGRVSDIAGDCDQRQCGALPD